MDILINYNHDKTGFSMVDLLYVTVPVTKCILITPILSSPPPVLTKF